MSRYPDETTARFDQQFAESPEERNERLARARQRRGSTVAPASFTAQLIATAAACQPKPSDRIVLARAAMKTAIACVEAKDFGAAHAFIEDALAQVRALRGLPVREG